MSSASCSAPGAQVTPTTVILELSNPDLQQAVKDAQLAYQSAQAAYENRKADLENQLLTQESGVATIESNYKQALLELEANEQLFKDEPDWRPPGEAEPRPGRRAEEPAQHRKAADRDDPQRHQVAAGAAGSGDRRSAAPRPNCSNRRLDDLRVKAGMDGVLQCVCSSPTAQVEMGAQVGPGTNLARVANPTNLKAELRIAETQTKDIRIGQYAEVDTRNGVVKGKVSRIDPASTNGTVGVDVTLEGALPPGARPDLSVDGTIRLEELNDIIYVGRPAFGQENSSVEPVQGQCRDGEAVRTTVKLGRSSVSTIEIVEGLQPGDQVILSDMSTWDDYQRVRLTQ